MPSFPLRAHALAALAAACPGASTPGHLLEPGRGEQVVACVVSYERTARDRPALEVEEHLAAAARRHAEDMVARGFFAHVSPGGSTPLERLKRAGYATRPPVRWGEVLAWGRGTGGSPARIVNGWLRSPPHREILLDPEFRDLGVGFAPGTPAGGRRGVTVTATFGGR